LITSFLSSYVIPYLPILVLLLLAVFFANGLEKRSKIGGQKRALREEMAENLAQSTVLLEFVGSQSTGESYVTPIPRFKRYAFDEMQRSGNLSALKRTVRAELVALYSAIDRINDASNRQEELLVGAPATSPIAVELRARNLTYIRDTVANVVLPILQRYK